MRRFTFVGGGSEKFWEVEPVGASVVVRFGRLGTDGQTQVKEQADAAAAVAQVEKLIAAKVKKGYVEEEASGAIAAPPSAPAQAAVHEVPAEAVPVEAASVAAGPPGEDDWVVPPEWHRSIIGSRDLMIGGPARPRPDARVVVDALIAQDEATIRASLALPLSDRLGRLGERHLDDRAARSAEADPEGAAALLSVAAAAHPHHDHDRCRPMVDEWVIDHGGAFAARATVHLTEMSAPWSHGQPAPITPDTAQLYLGYRSEVVFRRARALLAGLDDEDYAEARDAVADLRAGPNARLVANILFPDAGWLDDDLAAGAVTPSAELMTCVTRLDQVQAILAAGHLYQLVNDEGLVRTMVARIGPEVTPDLIALVDDWDYADGRRTLVDALAHIPTDEAFDALVSRVSTKYVMAGVVDAAARYPVRALRRLAVDTHSGAVGVTVQDVLVAHVGRHLDLARGLVADLPAAAAARVQAIIDEHDALAAMPRAELSTLPRPLADPPWVHRRKASAPAVVTGLVADAPTTIAWAPGQREEWAAIPVSSWMIADYERRSKIGPGNVAELLQWPEHIAHAPEDVARPALVGLAPDQRGRLYGVAESEMWRIITARFELDALAKLEPLLPSASGLLDVLLPAEGPWVATAMADALARRKTARPLVEAWLAQHPEAAARDLVPAAVGPTGKPRTAAEAALRTLTRFGHGEAIRAAAAGYGPEAVAAVDDFLALDPLEVLPARMPKPPPWLDLGHLPHVLLADRSAALPDGALSALVTMWQISTVEAPYAGVALAQEVLDPRTLAEAAWALYRQWARADHPGKDGWVMAALGLAGDDETARRLAPLVRAWPGESAHKRAVAGVESLSAIGTDVALMLLNGIAEKVKFKALKAAARERIAEVAEGLGLTAEQLADRLVPDFGLDPDGTLLLDYGPRRFRVGFDERLVPTVADEDGTRRKALPKPGASDDPERAPAAEARFKALKKDVRTVAADQVRRLERAMVQGRRWTVEEHRTLFVDHPLVWHLARRLVWATGDGDVVTGTFRVAEDRTLADAEDQEVELADDAEVGIVHPIHLDPAVAAAWVDLFADYEVLQPFVQLGRPVQRLTDAERAGRLLDRVRGAKVESTRVVGLTSKGWQRGTPQDGGVESVVLRPLPGGRYAVLDLDPGLAVGAIDILPEQTLSHVWLADGPAEWGTTTGELAFSELDPVSASELLNDLDGLVG